jgi:hypothetical protein
MDYEEQITSNKFPIPNSNFPSVVSVVQFKKTHTANIYVKIIPFAEF